LGLASLAACSEEDPVSAIDACIEQSIAMGRQANWTQGLWRVNGTGERTECTDEALNAKTMELSGSGIRVHQQGHYLFLENASHYPGFSLSGMVGDRCIHIRTMEQTPYGVVTYDLPAWFLSSSTFQGSFHGKGPGLCQSKGEFYVAANLDAIPARPIDNPAPIDAGTSLPDLCSGCKASCEYIDSEYRDDCRQGCEQYVCKAAPISDGGDSEVGASDGQQDATQEQTEDAVGDGTLDALEDGSQGDAIDAGSVSDAGDGGDAPVDVAESDSDPIYRLWDGSASFDGAIATAKASCMVGPSPGKSGGGRWVTMAFGLVVGWAAYKRRKRR
jgi:hypothetical protein